jgi:hypothetical protein
LRPRISSHSRRLFSSFPKKDWSAFSTLNGPVTHCSGSHPARCGVKVNSLATRDATGILRVGIQVSIPSPETQAGWLASLIIRVLSVTGGWPGLGGGRHVTRWPRPRRPAAGPSPWHGPGPNRAAAGPGPGPGLGACSLSPEGANMSS